MPLLKLPRSPLAKKMHRPFCDALYRTGEPINPWRCELCLTKPQRKQAETAAEVSLSETGTGVCCRKCGTDA